MKKFYILLLLLLATGTAFCQSITNREITWHTAKSLELHSNVELNQSGKIITRANRQIDYVVDENNTLSFAITGIVGSWNDLNTNGSLTYKVKYQGRPGKIVLEKSASGITITIDFTEAAPEAMKQKILIDSFE